jgi:hypothetical protein
MDMTPKLLPTITALAATAATFAPGAAQAQAPTTVSSLDVVKAYAFVNRNLPDHKVYAQVVFKTAHQLPRRFDGLIRAGGALDGTGHSLGSVGGRKTRCYTALFRIVDGRIAGPHGKKASLGSKHTLVVTARGTNGDLSDSMSVTLRAQRAGDVSGKPLGC